MVHFSVPVPVFVAVQPGGGAPALRLSKLTASASAMAARTVIANTTVSRDVFIEPPILVPECVLQLHQQLNLRLHFATIAVGCTFVPARSSSVPRTAT